MTIHIGYRFRHGTEEKSLDLSFQAKDMSLIPPHRERYPDWTDLRTEQCDHCPLLDTQAALCPIAANLVDLLDICGELYSYNEIEVAVQTENRTITATTQSQYAISSVIGLIMATSACPYTEFLRPLARFHLPFADELETHYRIFSSYMLAQFLRHGAGMPFSLNLDDLKKAYSMMEKVNIYIARRIRMASRYDAGINAVVLLDLFAKSMPFVEENLQELRYYYKAYL